MKLENCFNIFVNKQKFQSFTQQKLFKLKQVKQIYVIIIYNNTFIGMTI